MANKKSLKHTAKTYMKAGDGTKPIYEILLMSMPGTDPLFFPDGTNSGFPDMGKTDSPGFYYDLDDAIDALNSNRADLRETMFSAAFILCRFQGMYQTAGSSLRMYFLWDDERQGFFEAEEPELFGHIDL